jgi:hypothetical protein
MKTIIVLLATLVMTSTVSAQSLRSNAPAPMQPGVNTSTTDNFTGTHYWYFYGGPGRVVLTARFTGGGLLGNPMSSTLRITLSDGAGSFSVSKTLVSSSNQDESTGTFTGTLKARSRLLVSVAPPSQGLVRSGGQYQLVASGEVAFNSPRTTGDPIVQTFYGDFSPPSGSVADGAGTYGATRFNANGTLVASNGQRGTWKSFDPEHHLYIVLLDGMKLSLKYEPGRGLVDAGDDSIVFKAMR